LQKFNDARIFHLTHAHSVQRGYRVSNHSSVYLPVCNV